MTKQKEEIREITGREMKIAAREWASFAPQHDRDEEESNYLLLSQLWAAGELKCGHDQFVELEDDRTVMIFDQGGAVACIKFTPDTYTSDKSLELKPRDNEYMGILQEECAEVIQIISKINRFGLYSVNPFVESHKTNRDLLTDEVGDVYAMIQLLEERGVFTREQIEKRAAYKREKLQKYLRTTE